MDLETVKKHLRVDHHFEDGLISEYKKWAESEIKDSVTTSENRNEDYFKNNEIFDRAVVMLTAHYFEKRLILSNSPNYEFPYGVLGAIQKLRGGYYES